MDKEYTILIVEDDPTWQRKFKRYLKAEPAMIRMAATYQEALDLIEAQTFDLVILDVNLTGVIENYDGLRVGRKLWGKDRHTKIIVVSGSDGVVKRLPSFNFIPSYILQKQSLEQDEFIEKVRLALSQESPGEV